MLFAKAIVAGGREPIAMVSRVKVLAALFLGVVASSGCSIMPKEGPGGGEIRDGHYDAGSLPYAEVKITPRTLSVLAAAAPELGRAFRDTRPPRGIVFGVGDIVAVTIFEAAAGGLFIPSEAGVRPGNFVTLPNQAIDNNGNISIPYAGLVKAAGRTPPQVQDEIVNALRNRAIEPQVVVSTADQRTSLVSVLGDVNAPIRMPANAAGEHLLDTITRAGGPKGQGYDEWVMLERDNRREIVPFGAIVYEPRLNNIWTHPNDTVYLYLEPQTFAGFGASGQQGQFNFGAWRISLAEGLGKMGGLNDTLAEPSYVFLYRGETREVAAALGIDCTPYQGPIIPVVYNLNLRDPAGYFLATKFQMRNKDVIYAANAEVADIAKAMNFFRLTVATVNDPIVAATNVY
ncbi:MAG TPA: polysaccharide biosynthesis/export family protein, partial [Candidatus Binataceae bacterium]|nr:polysaccharide biosynthesis/export family protein [Candidatus Binataceae bacterium]